MHMKEIFTVQGFVVRKGDYPEKHAVLWSKEYNHSYVLLKDVPCSLIFDIYSPNWLEYDVELLPRPDPIYSYMNSRAENLRMPMFSKNPTILPDTFAGLNHPVLRFVPCVVKDVETVELRDVFKIGDNSYDQREQEHYVSGTYIDAELESIDLSRLKNSRILEFHAIAVLKETSVVSDHLVWRIKDFLLDGKPVSVLGLISKFGKTSFSNDLTPASTSQKELTLVPYDRRKARQNAFFYNEEQMRAEKADPVYCEFNALVINFDKCWILYSASYSQFIHVNEKTPLETGKWYQFLVGTENPCFKVLSSEIWNFIKCDPPMHTHMRYLPKRESSRSGLVIVTTLLFPAYTHEEPKRIYFHHQELKLIVASEDIIDAAHEYIGSRVVGELIMTDEGWEIKRIHPYNSNTNICQLEDPYFFYNFKYLDELEEQLRVIEELEEENRQREEQKWLLEHQRRFQEEHPQQKTQERSRENEEDQFSAEVTLESLDEDLKLLVAKLHQDADLKLDSGASEDSMKHNKHELDVESFMARLENRLEEECTLPERPSLATILGHDTNVSINTPFVNTEKTNSEIRLDKTQERSSEYEHISHEKDVLRLEEESLELALKVQKEEEKQALIIKAERDRERELQNQRDLEYAKKLQQELDLEAHMFHQEQQKNVTKSQKIGNRRLEDDEEEHIHILQSNQIRMSESSISDQNDSQKSEYLMNSLSQNGLNTPRQYVNRELSDTYSSNNLIQKSVESDLKYAHKEELMSDFESEEEPQDLDRSCSITSLPHIYNIDEIVVEDDLENEQPIGIVDEERFAVGVIVKEYSSSVILYSPDAEINKILVHRNLIKNSPFEEAGCLTKPGIWMKIDMVQPRRPRHCDTENPPIFTHIALSPPEPFEIDSIADGFEWKQRYFNGIFETYQTFELTTDMDIPTVLLNKRICYHIQSIFTIWALIPMERVDSLIKDGKVSFDCQISFWVTRIRSTEVNALFICDHEPILVVDKDGAHDEIAGKFLFGISKNEPKTPRDDSVSPASSCDEMKEQYFQKTTSPCRTVQEHQSSETPNATSTPVQSEDEEEEEEEIIKTKSKCVTPEDVRLKFLEKLKIFEHPRVLAVAEEEDLHEVIPYISIWREEMKEKIEKELREGIH